MREMLKEKTFWLVIIMIILIGLSTGIENGN